MKNLKFEAIISKMESLNENELGLLKGGYAVIGTTASFDSSGTNKGCTVKKSNSYGCGAKLNAYKCKTSSSLY